MRDIDQNSYFYELGYTDPNGRYEILCNCKNESQYADTFRAAALLAALHDELYHRERGARIRLGKGARNGRYEVGCHECDDFREDADTLSGAQRIGGLHNRNSHARLLQAEGTTE